MGGNTGRVEHPAAAIFPKYCSGSALLLYTGAVLDYNEITPGMCDPLFFLNLHLN
jgi:hypothetical protein